MRPLLKYVKARSGEEIAHIPHFPHRRPQKAGTKVEFRLVMGVNKVKYAVTDGEIFLGQLLEQLYGAAGLFYFKQFGRDTWVLTKSPQYASIYAFRQQVKPR